MATKATSPKNSTATHCSAFAPSTGSVSARAYSSTSTTSSTRNTRRSVCSARQTTCSATTSTIRASSGPARRARHGSVCASRSSRPLRRRRPATARRDPPADPPPNARGGTTRARRSKAPRSDRGRAAASSSAARSSPGRAREERALRHVAHAHGEIGREARAAHVGGMARRALRLKHAPADVGRKIGATTGRRRRTFDSIRGDGFARSGLRRAGLTAERGAESANARTLRTRSVRSE